MGKLTLTIRQRKAIAVAATAVTALLVLDLCLQISGYLGWRRWATDHAVYAASTSQPAATQPASTQPASSPASTQAARGKPDGKPGKPEEKPGKRAAPPKEIDPALKARNLFVPPKPGGHGLSLTGVLGRMAMFRTRDGKPLTIEEGQSEKGVTVKSIDGYEVVIQFEGRPETMKLFEGGSGGPSMPSMPNGPPPGAGPMSGPMAIMAQPPPGGGPVMMPPNIDLSQLPPEIRERIKRRK